MQDQNLKELEVLSSQPVTILVGGKMFKAGMLTASDFAECSSWRASAQAAKVLDLIGTNPIVDLASLKADTISRILTKEFGAAEMLRDSACMMRLAEIMLKRGGEWKGNWEFFQRNLDTVSYRDLEIAVYKMSGYWSADMDKAAKGETPANPTQSSSPSP